MRSKAKNTAKKGKKKGDKATTILLCLIFFIGFCILLYPKVSNYWNSFHATRAIVSYTEAISEIDTSETERMISEAQEYNQAMLSRPNALVPSEAEKAKYEKLLNISGTGVMGYIEIPSIKVELPIYHGTEESVLQIAVGHLDWTSLPVGGESTHASLSGHRGLPSAELFTHLDQLVEGDTFTVWILNEGFSYEVDSIQIVLPSEIESLLIRPGEDLCTLITCTPYGINTHRILVTGHRIDLEREEFLRVTSEATQVDSILVAAFLSIPLMIALFIVMFLTDKRSWQDKLDYDDYN